MSNFSNILVGVDLSHGDWMASADGDTPAHNACQQAIALAAAVAKGSDSSDSGQAAKLHFLAALDLDERTKRLIAESPADESTVVEQAEHALSLQVSAASASGVSATSEVQLGRPREVLLQRATEAEHDLVMVGSRGHSLLGGMLMGSTALALLSRSPCPVWVVKPSSPQVPRRILVGTDFSPVCQQLLDMGQCLAGQFGAELHVTHVVETAARPFLQFSQVDQSAVTAAHDQAVAAAKQKLAAIAPPAITHLEEGVASSVIIEQTKQLDIDLLLFGTVAWSGVSGMMIGSTAQKMLPELGCSLLTTRPPAGAS